MEKLDRIALMDKRILGALITLRKRSFQNIFVFLGAEIIWHLIFSKKPMTESCMILPVVFFVIWATTGAFIDGYNAKQ